MSQEIVERAKADLLFVGRDLSGNNGAFQITMLAASRIPNAGVVDKPNGNHAEFRGAFYSVDGIMFPDGTFYDVLVDGGGESRPVWNQGGNIDPARWRQPVAILVPPSVEPIPHAPVFEPIEPGTALALAFTSIQTTLSGLTTHAELAAAVKVLQDEIKQLQLTQLATRPAPVYTGSFLGYRITLRPEP